MYALLHIYIYKHTYSRLLEITEKEKMCFYSLLKLNWILMQKHGALATCEMVKNENKSRASRHFGMPSILQTDFMLSTHSVPCITIQCLWPARRACSCSIDARNPTLVLQWHSKKKSTRSITICNPFEGSPAVVDGPQRGSGNYSTYSIECYVWEKKWFTECNNKTYVAWNLF